MTIKIERKNHWNNNVRTVWLKTVWCAYRKTEDGLIKEPRDNSGDKLNIGQCDSREELLVKIAQAGKWDSVEGVMLVEEIIEYGFDPDEE